MAAHCQIQCLANQVGWKQQVKMVQEIIKLMRNKNTLIYIFDKTEYPLKINGQYNEYFLIILSSSVVRYRLQND